MKTLILGDIHGDSKFLFKRLAEITTRVDSIEQIVLLGDIGFAETPRWLNEPSFESTIPIYYLLGNHDHKEYVELNSKLWSEKFNWHYLPTGTLIEDTIVIGGAYSIDKAQRTIGINWWDSEELTHDDMSKIDDLVRYKNIHTVLSHDCPFEFLRYLVYQPIQNNRTSGYLQFFMETNKPRFWYCGHHHKNKKGVIGVTNIRVLNTIHSLDHEIRNLPDLSGKNEQLSAF
jgi:predicted phosphohydrolase